MMTDKLEKQLRNYDFRIGFCIGMGCFATIETFKQYGIWQGLVMFSAMVFWTVVFSYIWRKYPNL